MLAIPLWLKILCLNNVSLCRLIKRNSGLKCRKGFFLYTTREKIKLPETRVIHIHLNCVWESWQLRTRYKKERICFIFLYYNRHWQKTYYSVCASMICYQITPLTVVCNAWLYENIEWMMKNLNVNVTKITVIIECVEACKYMLENGTQFASVDIIIFLFGRCIFLTLRHYACRWHDNDNRQRTLPSINNDDVCWHFPSSQRIHPEYFK